MKLNRGSARRIRNAAWMRPRIPPMIKAEEADAICFFLCPLLAISKVVLLVASPALLLSVSSRIGMFSKLSVSLALLGAIVSSSATNEVVTLTRGKMAILDT